MAAKSIVVEAAQAKDIIADLVILGVAIGQNAITEDKAKGIITISVDLTQEQEAKLNAAHAGKNVSVVDAIKGGMDTVAELTTDVADTAVTGIFVPLTGIAVKTAAGVGRIAVKATAQAGASIINNLITQGIRAANDISTNEECNQVKSNFALLKAKFAKKSSLFKIS